MTTLITVSLGTKGVSPYNGKLTGIGAATINSKMTESKMVYSAKLSESLDTSGITMVMKDFAGWLNSVDSKLLLVSDNNGWDFMWLAYYFDMAGIPNPFGHSSRRISDFHAGLVRNWKKTQEWKKLRPRVNDTSFDDSELAQKAKDNAIALIRLIEKVKADKAKRILAERGRNV